jgi:hypothetical protein
VTTLTPFDLDLGGRRLHVVTSGHGSPAVILEAGSGCWSEIWRAVQETAGEFTATYSYDRAGHGRSEPDNPWSLESWVADLEAWLSAGQVPPPYLLVRHGDRRRRPAVAPQRRRYQCLPGRVLVGSRHRHRRGHPRCRPPGQKAGGGKPVRQGGPARRGERTVRLTMERRHSPLAAVRPGTPQPRICR